jgi:hypothetical protein
LQLLGAALLGAALFRRHPGRPGQHHFHRTFYLSHF